MAPLSDAYTLRFLHTRRAVDATLARLGISRGKRPDGEQMLIWQLFVCGANIEADTRRDVCLRSAVESKSGANHNPVSSINKWAAALISLNFYIFLFFLW